MPLDGASATRLAELLLPERPAPDRRADRRRRRGQPVLHRGGVAGDPGGAHARRDSGAAARHGPGGDRGADRPAADRREARPPGTPRCSGTPSRRARSATCSQQDPADLLWSLRRKALVEERTTSDAGSYAFRHQLIRDVAYNSLPRAERAGLHEQAADALMAREPFAERAELVAYHLDPRLRAAAERRSAGAPPARRWPRRRPAPSAAAPRPEGRSSTSRRRSCPKGRERIDWLLAAGEVALRRWRGDYALRLYTAKRPRAAERDRRFPRRRGLRPSGRDRAPG